MNNWDLKQTKIKVVLVKKWIMLENDPFNNKWMSGSCCELKQLKLKWKKY